MESLHAPGMTMIAAKLCGIDRQCPFEAPPLKRKIATVRSLIPASGEAVHRAGIGRVGAVALMVGVAALVAPSAAHAEVLEGVRVSYGEIFMGGRGGDNNTVSTGVANIGDTPIYGIRMVLAQADTGINPTVDAANCTKPGTSSIVCDFAVTLAPHTAYGVTVPYHVEDRWPYFNQDGDYVWELLDPADPLETTGSGPAFALSPPGGALPADPPKQEIVSGGNQFLRTVRYGGAAPDLSAVSSTPGVKAAVGATVRPTLALRNAGTVALNYRWIPDDGSTYPLAPLAKVAIPAGVSVLSAPRGCLTTYTGEVDTVTPIAGRKTFTCGDWAPIKAGATLQLPFSLRVDKVVPNAKVTVAVAMAADGVSTNNTASFVINAKDVTAPTITIAKPKSPTRASSWKVVSGTAADRGNNARSVVVSLFEVRGKTMYFYDGRKGKWVKGKVTRANVKKATMIVKIRTGRWAVKIKGVRKGRLVVTAFAVDSVGNTSATKQRTQKITR
jgi:hypothetical protein